MLLFNRVMKKISNNFRQRALTIIFMAIFAGIASAIKT